MLLGLMRKHAKSFLIKIMIAIIAVSFVLYFGFRYTDQIGTKYAKVNGDVITIVEYQKARKMLKEQLEKQLAGKGERLSEKELKELGLDKKVFDSLVNEKLVSQAAEKAGLDVTQKELQDHIMKLFPVFQGKDGFDQSRYDAFLQGRNMQLQEFEKEQSRFLLIQKVNQFLTCFGPVTRQEILDDYTLKNQKVKISFLFFPAAAFENTITLDPKALETYFDQNKENYRIPDRIKVAYLIFDSNAFQDKVKVDEKEIENYYEDNLNRFQQKKQVRARHILLRSNPEAKAEDDQKIKEKALGVLKRARAGEDFAKLAKEFSQDPASASQGGLLDYFSEGRMVKEFEREAFKLKKGEINKELVRTTYGYHIIKIEDIKEGKLRSLEEVRPEITQKLLNMALSDYTYEYAQKLRDQTPYDVDLKQYGKEKGMPVKESGYFSQDEPIPEWLPAPKINEMLFELAKGDISEVTESQDKYYIFQVTERKASYLPSLKEVQGKVQKAFVAGLAKAEAKKEAESDLAKLKQGEEWDRFTKDKRFPNSITGFFKRDEAIPQLSEVPGLVAAAFELNEKQKYPEKVLENDQGAYIVRWEGSEGIDQVKEAEDIGQNVPDVQGWKQQNIATAWMAFLKSSAKIEILYEGKEGEE